jgi:hypothetical protein
MKNQPYGLRDGGLVTFSDESAILINPPSQPCVGSGGFMMAIVFGTKPERHINSSYGSLAFGVIGFGPCARSTGATRRYIENVVNETLDSVLQQIGKTQ